MAKNHLHTEIPKDWNDIIFNNRNKNYGAYDIRKSYYKHLFIGVICMFVAVCLWFLFYFLSFDNFLPKPPEIKTSTIHLKEYKLPPAKPLHKRKTDKTSEIPKERALPKEDLKPKTENSILPFIVTNEHIQVNPLPKNDAIVNPPPPLEKKVDELTFKKPDDEIKKADEVIDPLFDIAITKVTSIPQFLGGKVGWDNFLKRNLNLYGPLRKGAMPATYVAIIGFYVHPDSTVTNFKIVKDPGYGMGEEGLRVLKMSGKWKPGTKNNKPVTFAQLQTIVFKVTE